MVRCAVLGSLLVLITVYHPTSAAYGAHICGQDVYNASRKIICRVVYAEDMPCCVPNGSQTIEFCKWKDGWASCPIIQGCSAQRGSVGPLYYLNSEQQRHCQEQEFEITVDSKNLTVEFSNGSYFLSCPPYQKLSETEESGSQVITCSPGVMVTPDAEIIETNSSRDARKFRTVKCGNPITANTTLRDCIAYPPGQMFPAQKALCWSTVCRNQVILKCEKKRLSMGHWIYWNNGTDCTKEPLSIPPLATMSGARCSNHKFSNTQEFYCAWYQNSTLPEGSSGEQRLCRCRKNCRPVNVTCDLSRGREWTRPRELQDSYAFCTSEFDEPLEGGHTFQYLRSTEQTLVACADRAGLAKRTRPVDCKGGTLTAAELLAHSVVCDKELETAITTSPPQTSTTTKQMKLTTTVSSSTPAPTPPSSLTTTENYTSPHTTVKTTNPNENSTPASTKLSETTENSTTLMISESKNTKNSHQNLQNLLIYTIPALLVLILSLVFLLVCQRRSLRAANSPEQRSFDLGGEAGDAGASGESEENQSYVAWTAGEGGEMEENNLYMHVGGGESSVGGGQGKADMTSQEDATTSGEAQENQCYVAWSAAETAGEEDGEVEENNHFIGK